MRIAFALATLGAAACAGCGGDEPSLGGSPLAAPETVFVARPPPESPPTGLVDVDGHTGRIAFGDGAVWVTAFGARAHNRVVRIDPATSKVTARIPIKGGPFEIAAGKRAIWVTGNFTRRDDVLHRIDPRTNRVVATIPLPGRYAGQVATGAAGVWLLVSGRDNPRSQSLVRIDPATNEVLRTVPLRAAKRRYVDELAVGKGVVWLLALRLGKIGELPGEVMRFDPRANRVTAKIDAKALNMGLGPGGLWITGCVDCGVHRRSYFARDIDTEANAPVGPRIAVRRVSFGPLFVGRARVWFGGYEDASGTIAFSLNPETGRIERFLRLGSVLHTGMAVDSDARVLWVALALGSVARVDLARR